MKHIYIIGLAGSGKTTLGRQLAACFDLQHIEIDAINWQPGWQALPRDELLEKVRSASTTAQEWVVEGNYQVVREMLVQAADTIIWLDYPLLIILWRLFRRTCKHVVQRTVLWNGNRETLRNAFLDRNALILYVINVFRKRRRLYTRLFVDRPNPRATYLRFRSPKELEQWMREVTLSD